jgi:TetR/AcrR family transcriptional regulator
MTTKRRNTEVRQIQIINAAREMIVKNGSEHVTIRRIARAVGISEAAVYRHFKSKADIFYLLADHIEENLVGDIERALRVHSSSLSTIDNVMRDHISAIEQRQGLSHQVIAEIISFGNKKLNKRCYEIVEQYIGKLGELIKLGIKSGELREDIDPQITALHLYGMIDGLVSIWALSNFSFNLMERYEPLWKMFRASIMQSLRIAVPI